MAVETFLTRMNALVDELRAHPKVTLLNYHVPPPATEEDFSVVETHIGMPLPIDIKTFYRQCNGLQLRWVHKDNKHVDQKLWSGFMDGGFDYEEIVIEQGLEGVVNILDICSVFFQKYPFVPKKLKSWQLDADIQFGGKIVRLSAISPYFRSFDLLSSKRSCGIYIEGQNRFWFVLMHSEHQLPSAGGFAMTLGQYLDLVILKKGCADARVFQTLAKEIDYDHPQINELEDLSGIGDPSPFDLEYPFHRS